MNKSEDKKFPKVFISYSHRDENIKNVIYSHLKVYEKKGKLKIWHDRLIDPGNKWKEKLNEELESCDVAVLLISNDFLISDFIIDIEFKKFLEREQKDEVYIFPILIDFCNWKEYGELSKFQLLPNDADPVISFSSENGERTKIITEIANKIANMSDQFYKRKKQEQQISNDRQKTYIKVDDYNNNNLETSFSDKALEIYRYSSKYFRKLLIEKSQTNLSYLNGKPSINYYEEYFKSVRAKTIVVENNYLDSNYLNDFSRIYSKSFIRYRRTCTRLHFFNCPFSIQEFSEFLMGKVTSISVRKLNEKYLGNMVIKPISKDFIGITHLKSIDNSKKSSYMLDSPFSFNLYGLLLKINSVPFQEQDTNVSPYSLNAVWSLLQVTSKLYKHTVPSIHDLLSLLKDRRLFPSGSFKYGLTISEVANILKEFSVEPYILTTQSPNVWKNVIHSYLSSNIPIFLGLSLYDFSGPESYFIGRHAVTVTGIQFGHPKPVKDTHTNIFFKSSKINKLYVHDDQVGPYSSLVFEDGKRELHGPGNERVIGETIGISWFSTTKNSPGFIKARPDSVLVPLHKNISVTYDEIYENILHLNSFIEIMKKNKFINLESEIEWDFYLVPRGQLKSQLIKEQSFEGSYKKEILLKSLPNILWKVSALVKEKKLIELLFDATNIGLYTSFLMPIIYDKEFYHLLKELGENSEIINFDLPVIEIFKRF